MKQISRNKDNGNAIERYGKSFCHALSGLWYAIKCEHNMIIILLATIVVTVAGVYFKISTGEWLFCLTMIGMVSATEMINTSIEAVVDLVTTEYHPLAKIAKDTASTATLLFSFTALIGALIIFIPKIMNLF